MNTIKEYLDKFGSDGIIHHKNSSLLLDNLCINYNGKIIPVNSSNIGLLTSTNYVLDKAGHPVKVTPTLRGEICQCFNDACKLIGIDD